MKLIEIMDVSTTLPDKEWVMDGRIINPRPGHSDDIYSFSLAGWVQGRDRMPESLVVTHRGKPVKIVPFASTPAKISIAGLIRAGDHQADFQTEVSVTSLPSPCIFDLSVQFADGPQVPFGTVQVRHQPIKSDYPAQVQPLMITSLGRSGSTWSMRLFGEHPEIVFHRVHAYETMAANYWLHLLKVLTDPANHAQSTNRLGFADRPWHIGQNPYFTRSLIDHAEMRRWFGNDLIRRTAAFCQQNIDEYYLTLARAQGDPKPLFFAEKNRGNHIPRLCFGLYAGARELFVLRDFRDMACSMFAFNKKRGYVGVGPMNASDDRDFIRLLRPSIEQILGAYEERRDRSLMLHYEDLILKPEATLKTALEYIGVRADQRTIKKMLSDARKVPTRQRIRSAIVNLVPNRIKLRHPRMFARTASHVTASGGPAGSVGRWQQDLPQDLQDVAHESFGDLLEQAGYPVP